MIKWGRCNYRIKCAQRRKNGHMKIVNQQVNGYLCYVACAGYGGEFLWPIGVHKEGARWALTDLISGLKMCDYAKRPEEPDVLKFEISVTTHALLIIPNFATCACARGGCPRSMMAKRGVKT